MLKRDVLFVSGSLRRGSYNTALLREAANALPSGVGRVWLDGIAALPPYNEDCDAERAPAYNGSIPGGLKNLVDWASRPFPDNAWRDKPVGVIGASTGIFGTVWAQAQLRKALGMAGARVIDAEFAAGSAQEAFLPSGALRDPDLASGLRDLVAAIVDARPEWEPELPSRTVAPAQTRS